MAEQLTSVVYQASDSMLEFTDLSYHEQVVVRTGNVTLTKQNGRPETFAAVDSFALARGWSGTCDMRDGYRELATFDSEALAAAIESWGF